MKVNPNYLKKNPIVILAGTQKSKVEHKIMSYRN